MKASESMLEHYEDMIPFKAVRHWLGATWYKLKGKFRIYWMLVKDMFGTGSVQAAGIMVGVNAITGQISVKTILANGDTSVCVMGSEGAACLMEDLRMAIGSVTM